MSTKNFYELKGEQHIEQMLHREHWCVINTNVSHYRTGVSHTVQWCHIDNGCVTYRGRCHIEN